MSFRYSSTTVEADAIARLPEGFVIIARRDLRGIMTYHSLSADHTVKERVIRGFATVEEAISALPTMTEKEIQDCALESYFADGKFIDNGKTLLREFAKYKLDSRHVRRGGRYVFETVREVTGAANLYDCTEAEREQYQALMEVTVASGEIEYHHDPDAVHMTSELAEIVTSHLDQKDDIVRYIKERRVITRDVDMDHLRDYLTDIHRSVGEGFL